MASLQSVIDTICSRLTVENVYGIIRRRLGEGVFAAAEIIPLLQREDRSLDQESARLLAEAAFAELAEHGELSIEGDLVRRA